jgi:hypothetical protein
MSTLTDEKDMSERYDNRADGKSPMLLLFKLTPCTSDSLDDDGLSGTGEPREIKVCVFDSVMDFFGLSRCGVDAARLSLSD